MARNLAEWALAIGRSTELSIVVIGTAALTPAISPLRAVATVDRLLPSAVQARGSATGPTFEVASVKPNKDGAPFVRLGMEPGGRYVATNVPLRLLIQNAYQI